MVASLPTSMTLQRSSGIDAVLRFFSPGASGRLGGAHRNVRLVTGGVVFEDGVVSHNRGRFRSRWQRWRRRVAWQSRDRGSPRGHQDRRCRGDKLVEALVLPVVPHVREYPPLLCAIARFILTNVPTDGTKTESRARAKRGNKYRPQGRAESYLRVNES